MAHVNYVAVAVYSTFVVSTFYLVRVVLVIAGWYKSPVLHSFEKYGDEENLYYPLPNLLICVGAFCITQNLASQSWGTTAHPINFMNDSLSRNLPTQANPRWDESIGFRSYHSGGANFLLADGSVRFISENIDGPTYRALGSRAGNEPASAP